MSHTRTHTYDRLSNIGSIGGTYASPVTLYPQVQFEKNRLKKRLIELRKHLYLYRHHSSYCNGY